jgi:uncharacterized protein YkwD
MMKKLFLSISIISAVCLFAQSPTDLNSDIGQGSSHWGNNVNNNTDVETTFNTARRAEETQLGLPNNSLGVLSLPSNWSTLSDDEKLLFILNDERICRAGVDYGSGPVLGLPFEGVDPSMDSCSQSHADDLLVNNITGHTGSDGLSPFDRIDNWIGLSCHSFMSYGENLAYFWSMGGTNDFIISHAVYLWLYEDASSQWGHRRAALIQDYDSYGATGFTNDHGDPGSEGFIGVGVSSSSSYDPYSFGGVTDGDIVAFNVFDPVAGSGCSYHNAFTNTDEIYDNKVSVSIYPNPTSGYLKLYVSNAEGFKVNVINTLGQIISSHYAEGEGLTLEIEGSEGLYFINVELPSGKQQNIKVLKE